MISRLALSLLTVLLLLSAQTVVAPEPAQAGNRLKPMYDGESNISLPVYFATDRSQVVKSDKDLDYGKQIIFPLDALSYGYKRMDSTCTVPDDMESLTKCGWLVYPKDLSKSKDKRAAFIIESNAEVSHAIPSFDELVTKIKGDLSVMPRKEIVIYVHGCCLSFNESMQQAADLAGSVQTPVVAYCWGCSMGYAGSNMALPRTQERFNKFLIGMLTAFPDAKISVISSSIGTQLVHNFCLQRRPEDYGSRKGIDELIFSRADLDDVAFRSQLDSVMRHSKKLIVYVSKNDFQINVSGTLRWFFFPSQHGERAGHLRSGLQLEQALTVLDVSPLKMGHIIPYESVADILGNGGDVPTDSRLYKYQHLEDNLYRVVPQRSIFESAAKHLRIKGKQRACDGCTRQHSWNTLGTSVLMGSDDDERDDEHNND